MRCGQDLTLRSLITPTMLAGLGALAGFALLSVILRRRLARQRADAPPAPITRDPRTRRQRPI
jgi:hypothetical protein